MRRYCSWCYRKTHHVIVQRNPLRRDVHKCRACGNFGLICRSLACQHFAKGHSKYHHPRRSGSLIDRFKDGWHSEFCAEHDGSIASFDSLGIRLQDIKDYRCVFGNRKFNLVKTSTIAAAVVAGVVIVGGTFGAAAPEYAAALGSMGLLGSASTGTAIASLSGAALTSASLAAIGSGGVAVITAVGAALGGILGGVVSNRYVGAIKSFDIVKEQEGQGPSVIS